MNNGSAEQMSDTRLFSPGTNTGTGIAGLRAVLRDPLSAWPTSLFEGQPLDYKLGPVRSIDTPRPEDVATVLLEERDAFRRSPVVRLMLTRAMGDGLIIADGESWRLQRSVAAPVFRHNELEKLVPIFDKAAIRLADGFGAGGARTVLGPLTDATLDIIFESLFGDVELDRNAVSQDVALFLEIGGKPHLFDVLGLPAWVPRPGRLTSNAAARRLRAICAQVISQKRAQGGGGGSMTDRSLSAKDPETGKVLSDEQLVDAVMTFVGAGHETTSVALSWTLWLLAHRPELQEQLVSEGTAVSGAVGAADLPKLGLHTRVFQEAMRLFPPVVSVLRQVTRPVTVSGKELRRGDFVNLIAIALHRNPDHWPDPERFDPDRFLPDAVKTRHRFAYLPFGGGATMCIGWKLAMMEATVLLFRLLQSFRIETIEGETHPYPNVRITMRPDNNMPLHMIPRS